MLQYIYEYIGDSIPGDREKIINAYNDACSHQSIFFFNKNIKLTIIDTRDGRVVWTNKEDN